MISLLLIMTICVDQLLNCVKAIEEGWGVGGGEGEGGGRRWKLKKKQQKRKKENKKINLV